MRRIAKAVDSAIVSVGAALYVVALGIARWIESVDEEKFTDRMIVAVCAAAAVTMIWLVTTGK